MGTSDCKVQQAILVKVSQDHARTSVASHVDGRKQATVPDSSEKAR
jgi:hypothetical protein